MCLIAFAYKIHPEFPLVLIANRDEFYDRPTDSAAFWKDAPQVFAGRDLVFGGTWLGITKNGKFAALTNFREANKAIGEISRGNLVSDFLNGNDSIESYFKGLKASGDKFSGFNLLVGTLDNSTLKMGYFSNRTEETTFELEPGIYGLSNALLDTPWKKVERAKSQLKTHLDHGLKDKNLLQILQDRTLADDIDLPNTGIGLEREKILSSIFIETPIYGTRCSSIVKFHPDSGLTLKETVFR